MKAMSSWEKAEAIRKMVQAATTPTSQHHGAPNTAMLCWPV